MALMLQGRKGFNLYIASPIASPSSVTKRRRKLWTRRHQVVVDVFRGSNPIDYRPSIHTLQEDICIYILYSPVRTITSREETRLGMILLGREPLQAIRPVNEHHAGQCRNFFVSCCSCSLLLHPRSPATSSHSSHMLPSMHRPHKKNGYHETSP
jgi:hypothetical protein